MFLKSNIWHHPEDQFNITITPLTLFCFVLYLISESQFEAILCALLLDSLMQRRSSDRVSSGVGSC